MSIKMKDFLERTKTIRRNIIAVLVVAAICMSSVVATAALAYKVEVEIDGETSIVTTVRTSVDEILEQAEIVIDDNDKIDASDFVAWEDCRIVITRNSAVSITDGENEAVAVITSGTVADALAKAGIILEEGDELNYELTDSLTEGMSIEITRAFTVTVVAGKTVNAIKTIGGTVADALAKAGVVVASDEKLSHSVTDVLEPYMIIEVISVKTVERTETKKIAYKTIKKNSSSLLKGTTKVTQKGQAGEKTFRYLDTYEGDKLVSSELLSEQITKEAVNKIVLVGTKVVKKTTTTKKTAGKESAGQKNLKGTKYAKNVKAASELKVPSDLKLTSNNVPTSYSRKITGSSTAYCANPGAVTASGRKVKQGYVAVNPKQIPYGTELWIVGSNGYVYGYAIAADTGGFVYNSSTICDLFFWSYNDCINWGRRDITIYVLD